MKLNKVRRVIYRVLDFYPRPKRGTYRRLIPIFYFIDRYCLAKSDYIWFTTKGHIRGRNKEGYFLKPSVPYSFIPLGVDGESIFQYPYSRINPHDVVYLGVISMSHGLDIVLGMVSDLCGIYPDFRLHIAGSGPDESKIKQLTQELKIRSNCVIFHGYLSERSGELKEIVGKSALCLALYRDDPDGFMQYTEPAKAKLYLSYGTPVLMTRVPDLAAEFEKNKVGISADFSRDSIKQSIVKFLGDKKLQQSIRKNIPVYIRKFDTKNLLKKAMNDFIKTIKESEK